MEMMDNIEIEKAKALFITEIIEYVPHAVGNKTILQKTTGNISVASFDIGEMSTENVIPYDTFVQIIDGKAEIIIGGISNYLNTGQSIIMPAHISHIVKANERFKMILTIIKSGYE
jgi:quercetin dioxygenase-like cupin family protein